MTRGHAAQYMRVQRLSAHSIRDVREMTLLALNIFTIAVVRTDKVSVIRVVPSPSHGIHPHIFHRHVAACIN